MQVKPGGLFLVIFALLLFAAEKLQFYYVICEA